MRAFDIHEPLPAAALVLVLMNIATIFPLWPGNVGLLQAAVALPLVPYGVAVRAGFAFGIGLQAIEASVGVGVGLSSSRARGSRSRCSSGCRTRRRRAEEPTRLRASMPEDEPARARAPG